MVVTLNVKHAFNSANWSLIRKSLAEIISLLLSLVTCKKEYAVFAGISQGSYSTEVGYTDNIALVVVA